MADLAPDVAHWLPAARQGSAPARGKVFEACRGYLLMVAHQHLDPDLQAKGGASDLVQQTFLAAEQHFDQFRGTTEAELLGWLRQALLNNLAEFQRHYRQTAKARAALEVPLGGDTSSADPAGRLPDAGPSPSQEAMAREEAEAVQRALERLPDEYRQVILLRHQEELPFEDIGRLMGRSANAAEKLWARAVRRMRQELETPP
jgi:RNA polymerase sigma-70 factor (ECF subfamily)